MPIKLSYDQPIFYGLVERLMSFLPTGDVYRSGFRSVPYTYDPSTFILESDQLGRLHQLQLINDNAITPLLDITPSESPQKLQLKLKRGISTIQIIVDGEVVAQESFNCSLHATLYVALMWNWRWLWSDLIQVSQTVESRFHLFLYETKLERELYELLPNGFVSALALRNLLFSRNHPLTTSGICGIVSGLTGTIPHFKAIMASESPESDVDSCITADNDVSGQEVHFWDSYTCSQRRTLFLRLAQNLDIYSLRESDETLVLHGESSTAESTKEILEEELVTT